MKKMETSWKKNTYITLMYILIIHFNRLNRKKRHVRLRNMFKIFHHWHQNSIVFVLRFRFCSFNHYLWELTTFHNLLMQIIIIIINSVPIVCFTMKNSLISTNYLWYEFLCIFLFAISLFTFDSMWKVLEKKWIYLFYWRLWDI